MSFLITAQNLSLAWFQSMEYLFRNGGGSTNLLVSIQETTEEQGEIRAILDHFLATCPVFAKKSFSISTVANTIFPESLYQPHLGGGARQHLYETYCEKAYPVIHRLPANYGGTYFYRMINWPGNIGEKGINQLERVIKRMKKELAKPGKNVLSSIYEIGTDEITNGDLIDSLGGYIRIQNPSQGIGIGGFPCLSHISLTYNRGQLHMTALYRNQYFIQKAYGNYLALSRLLSFLSHEAGCQPGELLCIATHADAEFNLLGKQRVATLLQDCRNAINGISLA